jgi:hypothetical protein
MERTPVVQGALFDQSRPTPMCNSCGMRPRRRHYAVGWWSTCEKCARRNRNRSGISTYQMKCCECGVPISSSRRTNVCSKACGASKVRRQYAANKAVVLAALGGRCSCRDAECAAAHASMCSVTAQHLLEIEHTKNNGNVVRLTGIDGVRVRSQASCSVRWSRYKRALLEADHGMRILCVLCHRDLEHRKRLARRAAL